MNIQHIEGYKFLVCDNGNKYNVIYPVSCSCGEKNCKHMKKVKRELIRILYEQGYSDSEIEKLMGLRSKTVYYWRRNRGLPSHFKCKLCGKLVVGRNTFQKYCDECRPVVDLINRNKLWLRRDMKVLIQHHPNVAYEVVVNMLNEEGLSGTLDIIGADNFLQAYSYIEDGFRWMEGI